MQSVLLRKYCILTMYSAKSTKTANALKEQFLTFVWIGAKKTRKKKWETNKTKRIHRIRIGDTKVFKIYLFEIFMC